MFNWVKFYNIKRYLLQGNIKKQKRHKYIEKNIRGVIKAAALPALPKFSDMLTLSHLEEAVYALKICHSFRDSSRKRA